MKEATHLENHTEARFAIHGWRRYRGWAIVSIGIGAFLVFWANRPAADAAPDMSEHRYEVEGRDSCVKLYRRYLDDSDRPSPAAMHDSSWHIIQRDIPMLS